MGNKSPGKSTTPLRRAKYSRSVREVVQGRSERQESSEGCGEYTRATRLAVEAGYDYWDLAHRAEDIGRLCVRAGGEALALWRTIRQDPKLDTVEYEWNPSYTDLAEFLEAFDRLPMPVRIGVFRGWDPDYQVDPAKASAKFIDQVTRAMSVEVLDDRVSVSVGDEPWYLISSMRVLIREGTTKGEAVAALKAAKAAIMRHFHAVANNRNGWKEEGRRSEPDCTTKLAGLGANRAEETTARVAW